MPGWLSYAIFQLFVLSYVFGLYGLIRVAFSFFGAKTENDSVPSWYFSFAHFSFSLGVGLFFGSTIYDLTLRDPIHEWFSAPIVATLPDGRMATGKWWIDDDGTGHSKVTAAGLRCGQDYDGRNVDALVETTVQCSDGRAYALRIRRYGGDHYKDRGEGVWKSGDSYGWYVFGWKARLAILTGGLLGLPDRAPGEDDYRAVSAGV
ncbi:MAG: hypothetical protein Q9M41_07230 [Paracoccaceae bacterium]|nr:hypothetical protein [Paracoccaceae bacterium]